MKTTRAYSLVVRWSEFERLTALSGSHRRAAAGRYDDRGDGCQNQEQREVFAPIRALAEHQHAAEYTHHRNRKRSERGCGDRSTLHDLEPGPIANDERDDDVVRQRR